MVIEEFVDSESESSSPQPAVESRAHAARTERIPRGRSDVVDGRREAAGCVFTIDLEWGRPRRPGQGKG
jgi:hypothetical protein